MKTSRLVILIVLTVVLVEAMLLLRVWIQATAKPMDSEGVVSLVDTTDVLASPAALLTGEEALRESGVVDFTVLVAIEAYVVAAIVIVLVIVGLNGGWNRLMALRPVHLPDFVVRQMQAPVERRIWQPVLGIRRPHARHYIVHAARRGYPTISKRRS
jgi:hypothetical protein